MPGPVSIYSTVVFDLHPKVKDFLDQLNAEGQIDLDPNGYPFLVSVNQQGPNHVVAIGRNNRLENFVINPRRRAEPICSWNREDGFKRPQTKQVIMIGQPNQQRSERQRRTFESFKKLVNNMLES